MTTRLPGINRGKRRMALAFLLTSSTAAFAEPPISDGHQSTAGAVQWNPFVDSDRTIRGESIQLASGGASSTIRLKPIGKAIGLRSLDPSITDPNSAHDSNASRMTIELVPGAIRTNPLIDSVHHTDRPLVDAVVTDTEPTPSIDERGRGSTIILKPTVEPQSDAPIHFSLTDRQLPTIDNQRPSSADLPSTHPADLSPILFEAAASNILDAEPVEPVVPEAVEGIAPPLLDQPLNADVQLSAAPTDNGFSIIEASKPIPPLLKHRKRFLPPVAVKAVPLEIERTIDGNAIAAPVRSVSAFEPGSVALVNGIGTKLIPLYMNLAQVRSLTLGGDLYAVKIADTSICEAVALGPRRLKLIGTGEGVTQLVVFAEGRKPGKGSRQRTFEIHVSDAPRTAGSSLQNASILLDRSIHETFPECEVVVRQQGNRIVVSGRCDSQKSAKKIMRMVRKTCPVPVKDELIVE